VFFSDKSCGGPVNDAISTQDTLLYRINGVKTTGR